jgi:hypothetical protein
MSYNNPVLTFSCSSPSFTSVSYIPLTVFVDSISPISSSRLKVVLTVSFKNDLISILFSWSSCNIVAIASLSLLLSSVRCSEIAWSYLLSLFSRMFLLSSISLIRLPISRCRFSNFAALEWSPRVCISRDADWIILYIPHTVVGSRCTAVCWSTFVEKKTSFSGASDEMLDLVRKVGGI